jgi:hypothetical protein
MPVPSANAISGRDNSAPLALGLVALSSFPVEAAAFEIAVASAGFGLPLPFGMVLGLALSPLLGWIETIPRRPPSNLALVRVPDGGGECEARHGQLALAALDPFRSRFGRRAVDSLKPHQY